MNVYFDNAATTQVAPEVLDVMVPILRDNYGNPSSSHSFGRTTKAVIEKARRSIAKHLNASPGEVFFTSGGTEADNMAIRGCVLDLGVKHIITSTIEHHAVIHSVERLADLRGTRISYVQLDQKGNVDLKHLEELLQEEPNTLVSLMHANNEIGNLLPLKEVGEICGRYNAWFHSDTVQTMGHYTFDVQDINVHFITGSAHKFHGPKGVGFMYCNSEAMIKALIQGGSQERNMRGGTENLYGIVGLGKALDLAYEDLDEHMTHIKSIKQHMINRLREEIPGVEFNGMSGDVENSLYTVLNVSFPENDKGELLLFSLDMEGIAASSGSACSSGSDAGSHVLRAIGRADKPSVRFSFGRYNTIEEVDYCVEKLKTFFPVEVEH